MFFLSNFFGELLKTWSLFLSVIAVGRYDFCTNGFQSREICHMEMNEDVNPGQNQREFVCLIFGTSSKWMEWDGIGWDGGAWCVFSLSSGTFLPEKVFFVVARIYYTCIDIHINLYIKWKCNIHFTGVFPLLFLGVGIS